MIDGVSLVFFAIVFAALGVVVKKLAPASLWGAGLPAFALVCVGLALAETLQAMGGQRVLSTFTIVVSVIAALVQFGRAAWPTQRDLRPEDAS